MANKKKASKTPPRKKIGLKRKSYSDEKLEEALKAIKSNAISKKAASKKFGIPRTTLINKLAGTYKKSTFGPTPFLTQAEEKILVQWLITSMKRGFPRRKLDLRMSAQKILKNSGRQVKLKDCLPGPAWVKQFIKRNPEISVRTPEAVTVPSACVGENDIRNWFKNVEEAVLEEHVIKLSEVPPNRCFNADETGFQLCPNRGTVLAEKGVKNVFEVDCGKAKEMITVLFGFSAAGDIVPPSIVYPYKNAVPADIVLGVPEEFGIGHSETGWMTTEVYYDWVKNIFHPFLETNHIEKPVLLYVDGHKSHLNYQLSQLCSELGIILIALYPNSTRILQPADVSAFKPLKDGWKSVTNEFLTEYPGSPVSRTLFAPLLKKTVDRCLTKDNLINGFRATGLHPWNPDNIKFGDRILSDKSRVAQTNSMNSSKVLSCRAFEDIVGEEVLSDIKNENVQGTHINVLRKLCDAFLDYGQPNATPHCVSPGNGLSSEIGDPISGTWNSLPEGEPLTFEVDGNNDLILIEDDHFNANLPSTSRQTTCITAEVHPSPPSPAVTGVSKNDSIQQDFPNEAGPRWRETRSEGTPEHTIDSPREKLKKLLTWPTSPMRKGKRNVKRMPFFISSKKYREELEKDMIEKENKKMQQERRKAEREQKRTQKNKKIEKKKENKHPSTLKPKPKRKLFGTDDPSTSQLPAVKPKPGISAKQSLLTAVDTNSTGETCAPSDEFIRDHGEEAAKGLCFRCGAAIGKSYPGFVCDICEKKFHLKCNLPLISDDESHLKICDRRNYHLRRCNYYHELYF